MKIALAHEMLVKRGGAERVARQLAHLYPKSPLYTLFKEEKVVKDWFAEVEVKTSSLQKGYDRLGGRQKFLLPYMIEAVESLDFSGYDAVITSSSAFMHGIKTKPHTKHISYCHSPMRYAWDYAHEYTKGYSPLMQLSIAHLLKSIRQWDFISAQRPDILLANSEHVRKRIQKYWRRDAQVIYPPVAVSRFTPQKNHENFFLIVSTLTPFKRIDLAISAFNKIGRKLIIIGEGGQRKELESMAKDNIEFLGYKDDDTVRMYIENCRAFIFPGEEDFGITPVEAMAAGKPVLAYGVGGVLESVKAGVSGEFFSEATSESLLEGLTRLMVNERHYDTHKIRSLAERFDESVFEEKILTVFKNG